ncbi:MAG: diguanylate cyclase, partial [Oxalobacteraceae bacterium]
VDVLHTAADRLQRMCLPDDVVARLGGAEFALLQPAVEDRSGVFEMAVGIKAALSMSYDGTGNLPIVACVGYALDSHRHATIEKLLIAAEDLFEVPRLSTPSPGAQ